MLGLFFCLCNRNFFFRSIRWSFYTPRYRILPWCNFWEHILISLAVNVPFSCSWLQMFYSYRALLTIKLDDKTNKVCSRGGGTDRLVARLLLEVFCQCALKILIFYLIMPYLKCPEFLPWRNGTASFPAAFLCRGRRNTKPTLECKGVTFLQSCLQNPGACSLICLNKIQYSCAQSKNIFPCDPPVLVLAVCLQ